MRGSTLAEVVEGSFYSPTLLSEIELGNRRMPQDLAQHVDRLLKTNGFFERRCEDVRRARRGAHAEYFFNVLELEKCAEEIEDWAPMLFPGLLQTGAYARAVIEAAHPMQQPEEVQAKIAARLERAKLFDDPKAPEFWCVLHESLLLQPIVDDEAMADQLDSILALSHRRRVVPQIIPWSAGAHPFMMGMTRLMTFSDAPPVAYTEGMYTGQLIDDPALVKRHMKAYARLRATALPPAVSLAMIEAAAEEYRNGKHSN